MVYAKRVEKREIEKMTANPFKPGDKVKFVYDQIIRISTDLYAQILVVKRTTENLIELEGIQGLYHHNHFELVPYVDKPIEKTFEVGKKYRDKRCIYETTYTCFFVGKQISVFLVTSPSRKEFEMTLLNSYFNSYEEIPEEVSCEKILLVIKPKEGSLYPHLSWRQVIHNGFQNALNGFLEHGIKYNLEAAFESNYKNGKIEMIDITEKFKEACGISS